MPPIHYKNYATGVLSGTFNASTPNIYFTANQTGNFPDLPFNFTIYNSTDYPAVYNDPQFEIVRATGTLSNGYAVIRGFSTTTGSAKDVASKTYVAHQSIDASIFNDQLRYFRPFDYGAYILDDFNWVSGSNTNWTLNTSNVSTAISGTRANPGLLNLTTSAATSAYGNLRSQLSGISIASGITEISFLVKPLTTSYSSSSLTYRIGLTDATGSENPTNGIYFEISVASTTGLSIIAGSGNSFNATTSAFPDTESRILTNFSEYKIRINSVANTARFYINSIELAGSPISGGLPII